MNSKFLLGTYISVVLLLVSFPFLLDVLIKNGIFSFSPGNIGSWIDFSGSYVGAIIGASVVFFVAIIQTKKQNEQQFESMEIRAKFEQQKDMRFFYTTKLMEKIEETIEANDELLNYIEKLNQSMIDIARILTLSEDSDGQEAKKHIKICKSKTNLIIKDISTLVEKINHLNYYTELDEINDKIIKYTQSVIFEYNNIKQHYDKYYIDVENITEDFNFNNKVFEAAEEISSISQELRITLANVQNTLIDMGNNI